MSDEQQAVSSEQQPSSDQTLDQVYQQFNVEQEMQSFNPQQQQPAAPAQQTTQTQSTGLEIPDPVLDPNGYKAWQSNQNSEIRKALSQLTNVQQQLAVAEMRRREEADIQQAVSKIQEKVNLDPDFIEIALGQKARKDARFASIYNNRHKNPAAWSAALGAVANEMKGKYEFRADSQLAENVRAAKQSTQSSLTPKDSGESQNQIEARLDRAKSPREFEVEWQRIMSGS